uniref:Golgin B1 n=1 Tax=Myripristis murdjan TaxID=586833 RepID=A0A668AWQ7_9TELE
RVIPTSHLPLRVLQAVVCDKDVRFQEQIQKHEEELLRVTVQSQDDTELQQALHSSQRRCEELEEAMRSRSEVLEMLQQEVNSADQQKQILTAQFRQMEQELAEAVRQREEDRQQWAQQASRADAELTALRARQEALEREGMEVARLERELASLRAEHEAVSGSQEALEKEKMEVARLERELALMKEAELAAIQASHDASERDRVEITRLESELASVKQAECAAIHASQEAFERKRMKVDELEKELEENQRRGETLAEVWRHLNSLASGDVHTAEESPIPTDLSLFLDTLHALGAQLTKLKEERGESDERCAQVTHSMETLQGKRISPARTTEKEEAVAKIQQLEEQIGLVSINSHSERKIFVFSFSSLLTSPAHILALEQRLLEKDNELVALRECLAQAKEHSSKGGASGESCDQNQEQGQLTISDPHDSPTVLPDLLEDTPEEETTLVAEDTSVLSASADNESSPELIGPQSESPGESKGASSDEMVASSDSEVAHSSWTLLEAVNQDGGQEWPSILQDFGQLQLQSWEETSMEQGTSTVQVESSSVIIRETVQVQLTQHDVPSTDSDLTSGQVFAQVLADELQKRYSELMAELQRLRETSAQSQEKIQSQEEERQSLAAAKVEAESQVTQFAEELRSAREELDKICQEGSSLKEKHSIEMRLLEEQIDILHTESKKKEQSIQALQTDLEEAQRALSEQEGQARMLSAQLEDRELLSSELERRLQDMESSLLEYSQTTDLTNASLSEKNSEISELQLRLTQKEQEIMELNDSMSAKLLQVGEEKFLISSEVKKLKDQIHELEKARREEKQKVNDGGSTVGADDEFTSLQKEKQELETQLVNMKKKFQVALVQRKELMKKVADFEVEAQKWKEQESIGTVENPTNIPEVVKHRGQDIEEMEVMLKGVKEALKSKEDAVEALEKKICQQDQVLAETLALNKKLCEEAEHIQQADPSTDTELHSQLAALEAECETLQKKLVEAQEARKETIRKAKEKDRHHREQLKQQKEEYNELLERFEVQNGEQEVLLTKLRELEELQAHKKENIERKDVLHQENEPVAKMQDKAAAGDWVQEDWVDFASPETESSQQQCNNPIQQPEEQSEVLSAEKELSLRTLREDVQFVQSAHTILEKQLLETQASLSLKETELLELGKEVEALREKERQIDLLSDEMDALRDKYQQAESYAETLKVEMEAAAKAACADSESSIVTLQGEVEEFKQFLNNKNQEIMELSQQLSEQNSLLCSMQDTVSEKDKLIASLREELKAEQERTQKLEVEVPQKQEEEKDSEAKIQQLQRKLQAALISRKEVLKENKSQKEELATTEKVLAELQQKLEAKEDDLEKLRAERVRLIEEIDQTLLENQSLGSSCESLKLAMEGILNEKDAFKREAEFVKEEAAKSHRELEEKIQGMKDEYETLLKSYENVSDEAERVRRVLEAARQERQELAAKVRTHEAARQEAEKQTEEAQREVDSVKDKMRKFAKTKQQKIMELEEENESLREMEEKKETKRKDRALKAELERLQEELGNVKADLDATAAERDSLGQQIEDLREQLAQKVEKGNSQIPATALDSAAVMEEVATVQQVSIVMAEIPEREPAEIQSEDKEQPITTEEAQTDKVSSVSAPETHTHPTEERVKMELTEGDHTVLENKIRELEGALISEKKQSLMASLQQSLEESKDREKSLIEEGCKREAQFKELRRSLETEKDDLEERLMNQLAQLNGSIAGYQQEATDTRDHLAELQREVERLERERAELEVQAQSERDRAARLEEDKRQAQRERAEAEAESGKQRELEQQLRSAQRVKEGSQSRARQLEELLREKQLEVRQLQKDCIQYQERISELGREAKALQLGRDELLNEQEKSRLEISNILEELKRTEAQLVNCKSQLDEAQKEARQTLAEKMTFEQAVLQKEASMKAEAEQTLDSVRFRLGAELKQMELKLEEAYREKEKEEEATLEAREKAEGAERRAQEMQGRLDESLARLAAFSRCMSSLQDDRDRVLDEARQWEARFNGALQGKESEVREAETRIKELSEQLQKETALKDQLQLEKADKDWQLKLEENEKKVKDSQAVLEEERRKLQQTTAELQSTQNEARALENELEGVHHRTRALEEGVGRLQAEVDQARAELREREAEERRLCLNVEQLEADLRSSKVLTESLQNELSGKEKRELELLGEKEQAVTQAAEEARREADSRAQEAERALEQRREELRELEDKFQKTEEESSNRKAKLDSFMKAMGSLQDDRDRVLNMYKQLEEKHLQVMMEKDALIQEAAGENNSLKEELRSLLVQRDDLHAEKAKLSAQLHGYRDELNQVLSMKDSQHKQVLAAQRERITSLERQCKELEAQLKGLGTERDIEVEALSVRQEREILSEAGDSGRVLQVRDAPGAEVEKLREQLQMAREQVEALESNLLKERQEQTARNQELAELRWEGGVMRTESESAQERVAELARDLMVVEQKLLEEKEATTQLQAENQSLKSAMASLQDNRDQAVNKAQELSLRLEEVNKAGGQLAHSSPAGSTGEVWGLKNALQALQNDRERLVSILSEDKCKVMFQVVMNQLESVVEMGNQEIETLRLERIDWMAQAEQLKQQTLTTLSERDQQLRHLTTMLEEARTPKPKLLQEHYQREVGLSELDSAPGAPQERSSLLESHTHIAEMKELQRRLTLTGYFLLCIVKISTCIHSSYHITSHTQSQWHEGQHSETAVLIEPSEGAVTRTRRGGPGLMRMLRVAFCSRQRTPLLFSLYLLTVHVLLLLCLGGYL